MRGTRAERLGWWLALGWLVAFAAFDGALHGRVTLIGFFAVAPLIASAVLSPRRTAAVAALTVATAVTAGWWGGIFGELNHVSRIASVTVISVATVLLAVVRVRREEDLRRMTAIAEAAQRTMLPRIPVRVGDVSFAVRYLSATREALIGGDMYEVVDTRWGIRVLIGDVRGKGLEAVQVAAATLSAFRQAAVVQSSLPGVAAEISTRIAPMLAEEDFVTALLVEMRGDGSMWFVNCGHPPPLVTRALDVAAITGDPTNLPLGLETRFSAFESRWDAGARLLLYTDGLVETRNAAGEFLPLEDVATSMYATTPDACLDHLLAAVRRHSGGTALDDLALLLAERLPADQPRYDDADAVSRLAR